MAEPPRLIAAEDLTGCERWALPSMTPEPAAGGGRPTPLTAGQLEALQRAAYDEAFAEGREAGFKAGFEDGEASARAELGPLAEQCRSMLELLADPLQAMDEAVEESMVATILAIARQIVRRELRAEPGEVVGAVREALRVVPPGAEHVRIHLHPADVPLVRGALGMTEGESHGWDLVDDPAISRGGCRLETEHSRVDATVEGRLAAAAASLIGGQREEDGDD